MACPSRFPSPGPLLLLALLGCGARTGIDGGAATSVGDAGSSGAPVGGSGGGGQGGIQSGGGQGGGQGGAAQVCKADGAPCGGPGECCAACLDKTCGPLLACTPGQGVTILATDPWYTFDAIEVDGEHVYYTRKDGVARLRKTGGPGELVAPKQLSGFIGTFALNPSHIFSAHITADYGIARTAKGSLITEQIPSLFAVDTLRLSGDWLYAESFVSDESNRIHRMRLDGSGLQLLAEGLPNDAEFFQTDGVALYYGRQTVNDIVRDPIEGGATITLVADSNGFLAVDDGFVYFSSDGLRRVATSGGSSQPLAKVFAGQVAFSATYLYFTDPTTLQIGKIPKGGGPAEPVATADLEPRPIAVDDSCVYWIEGGQGDSPGLLKKAPR